MKNSIFLVFAFFLMMSCKTNRVEPAPPPPPTPIVASPMIIAADISASADRGVLMRNGTMMTVQDGEIAPMSKEMILGNGDKVMMNGEVIHKDGSKTKMEEGMKVLDTHLGSGSSRISANKAKLNFVGCEIDKEYFDKSKKRYDDFASQTTLF